MSKFWKWFLGIVLALVLFTSGVCVGVMAGTHMAFARHPAMFVMGGGPFEMPMGGVIQVGPGEEVYDGDMMEFGRDEAYGPRGKFHGNMHRGGGFPHHGGPLLLLGGLVHLALFFGLIYGAYWLGRRNARVAMDSAPAAPKAAAPASAAKPAARTRARKS